MLLGLSMRIGVFEGPADGQQFVVIERLILHGFLGELGAVSVAVRNEGYLLAVDDPQLHNLAKFAEVLVYTAANLGATIWLQARNIERATLTVEAAGTHHVVPVAAVPLPAEAVVHKIDAVLLRLHGNAVHKRALAAVAAIAARKVQANVRIGARDGLASVECNAAACGRSLSILEVAIAPVLSDEFTVPDVVPKRA